MPIPFALPLAAAGVGGLLSLLGQIQNRPVRSTFDPREILRDSRASALQGANYATRNSLAQLSPMLNSQGLEGSGIGMSLLSRLSSANNANAIQSVGQQAPELFARRRELDDNYRRERNAYHGGLLQSLGGAVGGIGGALEGSRQYGLNRNTIKDEEDEYRKLLKKFYGGEDDSVENNLNNLRSVVDSVDTGSYSPAFPQREFNLPQLLKLFQAGRRISY